MSKLIHEVERCQSKSEAISLIRERMKEQTGDMPEPHVAEMWLSSHLPLEKEYQRQIIARIRELVPDAFVWKAAQGPYSTGGIPDVCCVVNGRFYAFEVKRPFYGRPSDLQKKTIQKIQTAGGIACVVSFPWEVEEALAPELGKEDR